MRTSEQINEIAGALAKAQGEIRNPHKSKDNPHFRSKYADIADGLEIARPVLSKHGICIMQPTEIMEDGLVIMRTRLAHTSGQWIEGTYPVGRLTKHTDLGACMTYAKRQSLFALIGIAGDTDDSDGADTGTADMSSAKPAAPRKSSAAVKRENPEAWPTLEKEIRAATCREELTDLWKKWHPEFEVWPLAWRQQAEELFMTRADEVGHREAAE